MFHGDSRTELEIGCLGSGRIFRSGKRRKTVMGRGSCSATRGVYYDLVSHVDEGSCDKEEEYQLIFEEEEESEELAETPNPKHKYDTSTTLRTSPKVRSIKSSPSSVVNTSSTNTMNSGQGSLNIHIFFPSVSGANIMTGTDIKLSTFNGN